MIISGVGTQHFRGACSEIRHHGIDRYSLSGDQNTGLSGGAEICGNTARHQSFRDREGSIFFAYGAVGSRCKQPLPVRLRPVAIGIFAGGRRTSMSLRPLRAAMVSSGAMSASLVCMPLMMSSPA